jgi:hypothetical protein
MAAGLTQQVFGSRGEVSRRWTKHLFDVQRLI